MMSGQWMGGWGKEVDEEDNEDEKRDEVGG